MRTLDPSTILIPEGRHRRFFDEDKLNQLAMSIRDKGLLHAPVLRKTPDGYQLVVGERRLRAMVTLHNRNLGFHYDGEAVAENEVPYNLLHDLSPLKLREAELEENVIREDLTWQEKSVALAELDKLRKETGASATTQDTAREVADATDRPLSTVRGEIDRAKVVAEHLDDPEVAGARNDRDAYKIVSKKLEAELVDELKARGVAKEVPHTLILGDLTEQLREIEGVFDCIVTDPPYGMGADNFGDQAKVAHNYKDDLEQAKYLMEGILDLGYNATKPEAHLYMFCDIDQFSWLKDMATYHSWLPWRTPLVWFKGASGFVPSPDFGPRRTTEYVFYARKGQRHTTGIFPDLIDIPNIREKTHAAEKPPELYANLLDRCCYPGDRVLDPCCGTGAIFGGADMLGLKATGIEIDEGYYKEAQRRLLA